MNKDKTFNKLSPLPPLKKPSKKEWIGFDCETYTAKNLFYMVSFYNKNIKRVFYDKREAIKFIKDNSHFRFIATNLMFDYTVLFDKSYLIRTEYTQSGNLYIKLKLNFNTKISAHFHDTSAFFPASVKKLGKIVGVPKLDAPWDLSEQRKPRTKRERQDLAKYCLRDSQISYLFMLYLDKAFDKENIKQKNTISSVALELFKRNYLKKSYKIEDIRIIQTVFKAYYGGRTEVIQRGTQNDITYWDYNCYSEDTELLTKRGWVKYQDIKKSDIVFGMVSEELKEQKINAIIIKKFKGELISLKNENTDLLITPNHRVYLKKFKRGQKPYYWRDWEILEANKVPKTYVKFPNAKPFKTKGLPISYDLIRLLGWYITEGHQRHNQVEISQSWNHNPTYCYEIIDLLTRLKIPFRQRTRTQKGKQYLYVYFKWENISKFFKEENMNSYSIRLIKDYQDLSLIQKHILFDTLIKGDGSYQQGKTSYVSYSKKLLDEFQILTTQIGYKCSINKTIAHIKLNRDGNSQIHSNTKVKYKGNVWCLNVPLQNFVTRRNNKVVISGNSLYPSEMLNEMPDPNTSTYTKKSTLNTILKYHGVSYVHIYIPKTHIPLLPFRIDGKLIFPTGHLKGTWTHLELRKALQLGAKISHVGEGVFYRKMCDPFTTFITDIYKKRLKYKKLKDPIEKFYKTIMNSLYGKFAYRFFLQNEFVPKEMLTKQHMKDFSHIIDDSDVMDGYDTGFVTLIKKDNWEDPPSYIIPIWSAYITSYARLKLYTLLEDPILQPNICYMDTDSVMLKNGVMLKEGDQLGDIKLEGTKEKAVFIRPKMYLVLRPRIKGVKGRLTEKRFYKVLATQKVEQEMFTKFRTAMKSKPTGKYGLIHVNQVIKKEKCLNLDDTKRVWEKDSFKDTVKGYSEYFAPQKSRPIHVWKDGSLH